MDRQNIERINALTAISRMRELTDAEKAERETRRAAYRKAFREQFKKQLDETVVERPDGTRAPLRGPKSS